LGTARVVEGERTSGPGARLLSGRMDRLYKIEGKSQEKPEEIRPLGKQSLEGRIKRVGQ